MSKALWYARIAVAGNLAGRNLAMFSCNTDHEWHHVAAFASLYWDWAWQKIIGDPR